MYVRAVRHRQAALRRFLVVSMAALLCTLAACGGSSDSGGITPPLVTPPAPQPPPPGATAPTISAQPIDQTVVAPAAASFSVATSGSGVTYKWQSSIDGGANWSDIAGATDATFATAATSIGMNGLLLRAVASSSVGATISNAAALSVRASAGPAANLTLLAGSVGGVGTIDGAGTAARFTSPASIAFDGAGAAHIWNGASTASPSFRRISPQGFVSTLTLSTNWTKICFPADLLAASDSSGNLYFAGSDGTIRRASSAGIVSVVAGTSGATGATDGAGSAARFGCAGGLALNSVGDLYVADTNNHTIRKITPTGVVTTLAGSPGARGSADGTGAAAQFNFPYAVVLDAADNVFVADQWSHTIRKITPGAVVTTFAGTAGQWGGADGAGSAARFAAPSGLAIDAAGNLYVADRDNAAIRKITPAGVVTTVAGAAGQVGYADGTGSLARFNKPLGVAVDGAGNVFVADNGNATIRRITPGSVVTTWAGAAPSEGSADGTGSSARFRGPLGVAVHPNGNFYVADSVNHTIREISAAGTVTTLAGFAQNPGTTDANGAVARFNQPSDVTIDGAGNLLMTETGNRRVRAVTLSGQVTTRATRAEAVVGIAATPGGGFVLGNNVYLPLSTFGPFLYYSVFESVDAAGNATTVAGTRPDTSSYPSNFSSSRDGPGAQAVFAGTGAIAMDAIGNMIVADSENCTIRRITPAGDVSTLAGSPPPSANACSYADGTGGAARFRGPEGVALDGAGNIYVADRYNHAIRKITPAGVVTTVLGGPDRSGIVLGGNPGVWQPRRIAWLGGNRFVITSGNAVLIATLP